MTNNEAIGILAIVVETAKGRCFVTDEAISDAYAMTISALQAQEARHSNESSLTHKALDTIKPMRAIDADALIKSIDGNPFTTDSVKSYIHASVAKMPTIEPERKKGKWLEMAGDLQCSECGSTYHDLYPDYSDTKFCPNCGSYNGGENDQSK